MSATLYDTIKSIVDDQMGRLRSSELGVIEDIHPHSGAADTDNYSCTVRLRNSGLVLKRVPVATHRIGSVSIPSPGELVLIQFVGDDPHRPIVTGRLYNDEDRPPENDDGRAVLHLPLGAPDSSAVHSEVLSGDQRAILLRLGSALEITLQDDDPVVSIDAGAGSIQIDRDGAIAVKSTTSIEIDAPEVTIKASGKLTLKGATVDIN